MTANLKFSGQPRPRARSWSSSGRGRTIRATSLQRRRTDAPNNRQESYTYTRDGSPLKLTMPIDPGTYEVRYVMSQGRKILAAQTIEVTAVSAVLDAPGRAKAGEKHPGRLGGPELSGRLHLDCQGGQP